MKFWGGKHLYFITGNIDILHLLTTSIPANIIILILDVRVHFFVNHLSKLWFINYLVVSLLFFLNFDIENKIIKKNAVLI